MYNRAARRRGPGDGQRAAAQLQGAEAAAVATPGELHRDSSGALQRGRRHLLSVLWANVAWLFVMESGATALRRTSEVLSWKSLLFAAYVCSNLQLPGCVLSAR
jgi:hypothetical protein